MYQLFQSPDDGQCILIQTFRALDKAHKWWQDMSVDSDRPQHFLTENKRIIASVRRNDLIVRQAAECRQRGCPTLFPY